jgi:hypothetical protein
METILPECLQIFDTMYKNKDLNIFTPNKNIQFISKSHKIVDNTKQSSVDIALLNNPTVSFNGVLSSNRLINFIKNITFFHKNNIDIVVFTSNKMDLLRKLRSSQLNKWANKESLERSKYGPNRYIKVFKITSDIEIDFSDYEEFVIGPKLTNEQFVYELKLKIKNQINYNKVISLFNIMNKLSVERVRSL